MTTLDESGRWFRRSRRSDRAWRRIVCFPHAGGGASYFGSWHRRLPASVELLPVQYPGREDRMGETPFDSIGTMADSVAAAMAHMLDHPIVLFGHSMGAAVAYEAAARIQHRAGANLRCLVLSAYPAPQHIVPGVLHLASDEVLWADLKRLNGTDDALLQYDELRALVLAALRSDYRLSETYHCKPHERLSCAVVACLGSDDPDVTPEQAAGWRAVTSGSFKLNIFPGGDHFYVKSHRDELVELLLHELGVPSWELAQSPSTP